MNEFHINVLKQIAANKCDNVNLQTVNDLIKLGFVSHTNEITYSGKIILELFAKIYLQQIKIDELKSQLAVISGM